MNRADSAKTRKVVDETAEVRCVLGSGAIREEVWLGAQGEVVKYNLTFVNHASMGETTVEGWDMTTSMAIIIATMPERQPGSGLRRMRS